MVGVVQDHQINPISPSGVDQILVETIPIMAYSSSIDEQERGDDQLFRMDKSECVICLGELEPGEFVRLLPNCKHAFHVPCIDEWFLAHTSCPICRSPIVAATDDELPENNNSTPFPPSPLLIPSSVVQLPADHGQHARAADEASSSSSSGVVKGQSFGLLRHCASLVLPAEQPSSAGLVLTGLKRSLSMDQSSVIIDMQRESGEDRVHGDLVTSSSNNTVGERSMRYLDRVSTKLSCSFSRLRMGKNNEILPY